MHSAVRHRSRVVSRSERAIFHLSGRGVGLLPEKKKRRLLHFLEQLVVRPVVTVFRRRLRRRCVSVAAAKRKKRHGRQRRNHRHFAELRKNFTPGEIVFQRSDSSVRMEESQYSLFGCMPAPKVLRAGHHALSAEFGTKKRHAAATGEINCPRYRGLQIIWWAR